MTINEIQDNIIDEFSLFDDWMDKYNLLIDMGKDVSPVDPKFKVKDFLIEGCQSKVWLHPEFDGHLITFTADSDAIITRGIVALLIKVLSGRTPEEIITAELYFIDRIGLRQNLSPTRSNGLLSMVRQMKLFAMAYDAKQKQI
ncbi:MAG: Fe-S metabolism protein SufE [Bacteroidetes bacterium GWE2_41_25]|nr:MAG: Fe-S metabolism protein SufE [Bacteroidetes bacterium GWA2_40_15]OFX85159.1 MAG: Fe-S metabolism protein SufE [Bacteroidetes bacterium GWC2_40_22]OFX96705.1 MAG: Fe-S metabolism protein SufE [Bacteroidetes bacterium GWE2_41_25]OFY60859.1 MAG: Fe-S metabolism protein SufE [Bacteroidetes bacterium GWF2_41_9]HAM08982.1 Fe-S metabolism protein SufE [Bacteroidales bacterium]